MDYSSTLLPLFEKFKLDESFSNKDVLEFVKPSDMTSKLINIEIPPEEIIKLGDLTERCRRNYLQENITFQGWEMSWDSLVDFEMYAIISLKDILNTKVIAANCLSPKNESNFFFEREIVRFDYLDKYLISEASKKDVGSIVFDEKSYRESTESENVHLLEGNESSKYYDWIKSKNKVTTIKPYIATELFSTMDILSSSEKLFIISDVSGSGKTSYLHNLAKTTKMKFPSHWVIYLDLNNHTESLEKISQLEGIDIMDHFITDILKLESDTSKKIFSYAYLEANKVQIYFDHFEANCPKYSTAIMKLLKALAKTSIRKIVIATRPEWSEILEDEFCVLSCRFGDFKVEEFLYNTLKFSKSTNLDFVENVIKDILKNFKNFKKYSHLKNPKLCQMLANYIMEKTTLKKFDEESFLDLYSYTFEKTMGEFCKSILMEKKKIINVNSEKMKISFLTTFELFSDVGSEIFIEKQKELALKFKIIEKTNEHFYINKSNDQILEKIIFSSNSDFKLIRHFVDKLVPNMIDLSETFKNMSSKEQLEVVLTSAKEKNENIFKNLIQHFLKALINGNNLELNEWNSLLYYYFLNFNDNLDLLELIRKEFGDGFMKILLKYILSNKHQSVLMAASKHGRNFANIFKYWLKSNDVEIDLNILSSISDASGNGIIYNLLKSYNKEYFNMFIENLIEISNCKEIFMATAKSCKGSCLFAIAHHLEDNGNITIIPDIFKILHDKLNFDHDEIKDMLYVDKNDKHTILFELAKYANKKVVAESVITILTWIKLNFGMEEMRKIILWKNVRGRLFLNLLILHNYENESATALIKILDWIKLEFEADQESLKQLLFSVDGDKSSIYHFISSNGSDCSLLDFCKELGRWIRLVFGETELKQLLLMKNEKKKIFLHNIKIPQILSDSLCWIRDEFGLDKAFLKEVVLCKSASSGTILHQISNNYEATIKCLTLLSELLDQDELKKFLLIRDSGERYFLNVRQHAFQLLEYLKTELGFECDFIGEFFINFQITFFDEYMTMSPLAIFVRDDYHIINIFHWIKMNIGTSFFDDLLSNISWPIVFHYLTSNTQFGSEKLIELLNWLPNNMDKSQFKRIFTDKDALESCTFSALSKKLKCFTKFFYWLRENCSEENFNEYIKICSESIFLDFLAFHPSNNCPEIILNFLKYDIAVSQDHLKAMIFHKSTDNDNDGSVLHFYGKYGQTEKIINICNWIINNMGLEELDQLMKIENDSDRTFLPIALKYGKDFIALLDWMKQNLKEENFNGIFYRGRETDKNILHHVAKLPNKKGLPNRFKDIFNWIEKNEGVEKLVELTTEKCYLGMGIFDYFFVNDQDGSSTVLIEMLDWFKSKYNEHFDFNIIFFEKPQLHRKYYDNTILSFLIRYCHHKVMLKLFIDFIEWIDKNFGAKAVEKLIFHKNFYRSYFINYLIFWPDKEKFLQLPALLDYIESKCGLPMEKNESRLKFERSVSKELLFNLDGVGKTILHLLARHGNVSTLSEIFIEFLKIIKQRFGKDDLKRLLFKKDSKGSFLLYIDENEIDHCITSTTKVEILRVVKEASTSITIMLTILDWIKNEVDENLLFEQLFLYNNPKFGTFFHAFTHHGKEGHISILIIEILKWLQKNYPDRMKEILLTRNAWNRTFLSTVKRGSPKVLELEQIFEWIAKQYSSDKVLIRILTNEIDQIRDNPNRFRNPRPPDNSNAHDAWRVRRDSEEATYRNEHVPRNQDNRRNYGNSNRYEEYSNSGSWRNTDNPRGNNSNQANNRPGNSGYSRNQNRNNEHSFRNDHWR